MKISTLSLSLSLSETHTKRFSVFRDSRETLHVEFCFFVLSMIFYMAIFDFLALKPFSGVNICFTATFIKPTTSSCVVGIALALFV